MVAADRGQALSCTVTAINTGGAIQADSARVTVPAARKATAHKRAARRKPRRRALTHRAKRTRAQAKRRGSAARTSPRGR